MKKSFFALLLATSAMIAIAPAQNLSASSHHHHKNHDVYGSFYTTETGTSIGNNTVPFDSYTAKSQGVNLSSGNISIKYPGDYLVTYGTTISAPAEFQLLLNGTFVPGTQQTQGPGLYHPFSTIIHVETSNSILSVFCVTNSINLQYTESGDTTAYLTIVKVN